MKSNKTQLPTVTDQPIRVLLVGPYLSDPGGVAVYYNSVLPKIPDTRISIRYLGIGSSEKTRWLVHKVTDQVRFWRALRAFAPDIVHLNPQMDFLSFFRDGLFVLASQISKRKVLVFYHGWQIEFERAVTRYLLWFFRLTYQRADAFIVLAERFADALISWRVQVPILRHHTVVADELLDGFSLTQKLSDSAFDQPVAVLFLARLVEGKGLPEFLKAVRLLVNRGVSIRVTIAGDGPLMPQLIREVANFGEHARFIRVAGHVEGNEKTRLLRTHHIFCLPTRYPEGMPTAVLEAMAFGLAVVTCPAGGIADFFEEEKMGALLSLPDAECIAPTLERLMSKRSNLAEMARYNHNYAKRHFLASRAARFLEASYQEISQGLDAYP